MTRIKICGLSQVHHALIAAEAGADFIGMVFAQSKRQVSAELARQITEAMRSHNSHPSLVGVFANSAVDEVNSIGEYCQLDWIQLSGDESWDYCQQIKKPIIKTIHIEPVSTTEDVINEISQGRKLISNDKLIFLLDTGGGDSYGGTGQVFNWQVAKEISAKLPVIVAGGLTPDNVSQLINEVNPWGVDVSSGVESNDVKSDVKIRDFIRAVRQAQRATTY